MAHEKISYALTMVLAVAGVTACGGESNNTPPQTPADQTTTTAGAANNQYNQPGTMAPSGTGTTGAYGTGSATGMQPQSGTMPTDNTGNSANQGMNGSTMNSPVTATAGTVPAGGGAADTGALSDAQIVAIVQAADNSELDQSHEALRKAKSDRVKQFAQHMILDHSAAETKLTALDSKVGITPQTSPVADQLKANSDHVMSSLRSSTGSDFDRTYIDAQVNEHSKLLDLLDNKLIPHAQNPDLVKTLQDIRTKVSDHLKTSQGIQSSLGQNK